MGTVQEEDGWEYWARVYSDSALRNEVAAQSQDEPYLSEILSGEKLRRTKVVIENLPRPCSNQEVKNLLEAKIGFAKVINIKLAGFRGFVTFYEAKDAQAAMDHFNGKMFRGCLLKTRPDDSIKSNGAIHDDDSLCSHSQTATLGCDTSFISNKSVDIRIGTDSAQSTGDEPSTLSTTDLERPLVHKCDSLTSLNCDKPPSCSQSQLLEQLTSLLVQHGPLKYNDQRITDFLLEKPWHIQLAYFCWPLGAFRTRTQLRIIGGYLCLPKDEMVAFEMSSNQGQQCICRDSWEPIAPCQIWNNSDLAKYALAFLKHFGPSWLWDLPFTYLMSSLPCSWRRSAEQLAEIVEREVPNVMCIYDTLYLTSLPDHRQAAARAIRRGPS